MIVIGLLLASKFAIGQIYITEGKNRYTFAQTTFGYDLEFAPDGGYTYYRNSSNILTKTKMGNTISPTISITGLHFWGHAEFFTGFSVGGINLNSSNKIFNYKRAGATGGKYFPLALKTNRVSPYVGMALASFSFNQQKGVDFKRADSPILLGITYTFKKGLFELGCNYYPKNNYQYYISRNEQLTIKTPPVSLYIDYKYFIDLSKSSLRREKNGDLEKEYEAMKKGKALNTFSIALGPAYSFFTGESSYNKNLRPYLDDHQLSPIFPDIGLGYYHHNLNATLNLSWRFFKSELEAYGVSQRLRRNSLALELYKFIGDYHGFVPFVGAIASREYFNVREVDMGVETINHSYRFFTPGLIVGWDIRPTRTDWWGVRTNIRYFPYMKLGVAGNQKLDMQQVELNFLQMILYPNRIATNMKTKKSNAH